MKLKLDGLSAAAVLVSAAALLYFVEPGSSCWTPPCLFHELTGLHCPGCGTGRGLHMLVHGNLSGALRMNSLMVFSIPLMACLIVRQKVTSKPLAGWVPWLIAAVIAAFWLARNISAYPFTLLAPH